MAVHGKEGFWISPRGDLYEIYEHSVFIMENPSLFGLDEDDPRFKKLRMYRNELLEEAIRKGWIRVRFAQPNDMINFWKMSDKTIDLILNLYEKMPDTFWSAPTAFYELSTGRYWNDTVRGLLKTYAMEGKYDVISLLKKRKLENKIEN